MAYAYGRAFIGGAMFDLKKIHKDAVTQALERAHFYRLLNEPGAAESICLDVLEIDPENQDALVTLLLAITDRFTRGYAVGATQAKELLPRIKDEYQRAYYAGIICERQAKARLQQGGPGSSHHAQPPRAETGGRFRALFGIDARCQMSDVRMWRGSTDI